VSFARFPGERGRCITVDVDQVVAVFDDIYGATAKLTGGQAITITGRYADEVTREIERVRKEDRRRDGDEG
jgi:hypothetical protein